MGITFLINSLPMLGERGMKHLEEEVDIMEAVVDIVAEEEVLLLQMPLLPVFSMDLMILLEIQLCQERYEDNKFTKRLNFLLGLCDRTDDLVPACHLVSCLHLSHYPVPGPVLCRCCTGSGV